MDFLSGIALVSVVVIVAAIFYQIYKMLKEYFLTDKTN